MLTKVLNANLYFSWAPHDSGQKFTHILAEMACIWVLFVFKCSIYIGAFEMLYLKGVSRYILPVSRYILLVSRYKYLYVL